jgi:hypothetical protein
MADPRSADTENNLDGDDRTVGDEEHRHQPQQGVHHARCPLTVLITTYEMKPAPVPLVIEYVNGMMTMVRKAGVAMS